MEQQFYAKFGQNMRDLRQKLGLTQDDLASKLGVTRASISNVEVGKQRVLAHQIVELAQVLNVSIQELFPKVDITPDTQQLEDKLASVANLSSVKAMIRMMDTKTKRKHPRT